MEKYKGLSGNAGVKRFEILDEGIILQFEDGRMYWYDYEMPGKEDVEEMKRLAKVGKGLTTHVNQRVRGRYKKRL